MDVEHGPTRSEHGPTLVQPRSNPWPLLSPVSLVHALMVSYACPQVTFSASFDFLLDFLSPMPAACLLAFWYSSAAAPHTLSLSHTHLLLPASSSVSICM